MHAYNNLRNKRRLTRWIENKVNETGKDEHEENLEQEDREIICKWVISKPNSLGVYLINCAVAYERTNVSALVIPACMTLWMRLSSWLTFIDIEDAWRVKRHWRELEKFEKHMNVMMREPIWERIVIMDGRDRERNNVRANGSLS